MTDDILALCDERRKVKKQMTKSHSTSEYRKSSNSIKKGMQDAKEHWMTNKCSEIENNLMRHNSKEAYKVIKDLTAERNE